MVESRNRKERFEAKIRRLKAKIIQEILVPERLFLAAVPFILFVWLVGSITSLSRNWNLKREIAEREAELAYLNLQVENIELENQYYSSEEYQELAARRLQHKKLKGETLVYLPKNSEAVKNKHKEKTNEDRARLSEKSNLDQWLSFLFNL